MICLDFDLGCMWFGRWTDARARETREVPVSKSEKRKQTKQVPKYTTLSQVLGMADDPARSAKPAAPPPAIEKKVDELRRNPAELARYLREIGEG